MFMAFRKLLNSSVVLFFSSPTKTHPWLRANQPSLLNFQFPKFYTSDECKNEDDKPKGRKLKPFRHRYPKELEGGVNNQILAELNASMTYLSMFCYYGRTDVALPGCQSFFRAMYDEEQEHAFDFINYQLMRGAKVQLFPLTVPENMNWIDITIAFGMALELEKRVKEKLEELAKLAHDHDDLQLEDFVTSKYLLEQNESICEMGRLLTKAKRLVGTGGVGRHLFDKEVLKYVNKTNPDIKLPFKNI